MKTSTMIIVACSFAAIVLFGASQMSSMVKPMINDPIAGVNDVQFTPSEESMPNMAELEEYKPQPQ